MIIITTIVKFFLIINLFPLNIADLDMFGSSQIFFDEKSRFACTQRQKHGNAFLMSEKYICW